MSRISRPVRALGALALFALAAVAATLGGCNTVEGVGEDLQSASQNTREAISGD